MPPSLGFDLPAHGARECGFDLNYPPSHEALRAPAADETLRTLYGGSACRFGTVAGAKWPAVIGAGRDDHASGLRISLEEDGLSVDRLAAARQALAVAALPRHLRDEAARGEGTMAIRFVDVGSEKAAEAGPAPARRSRAPEPVPEAGPAPDGEAPQPSLPHAKPEPKPRGRKKPMSAVGADRSKAAGAPPAPLLDGLLPDLQAHAKPAPKPRGRKKAFG